MPRLFTGVEIPPDVGNALASLARRTAGRALDRSGELSSHAALHRRRRRRDRARGRRHARPHQARRLRSAHGGPDLVRRPQAARGGGAGGAGAAAHRRAGRAGAPDAADRAGAGGPQIHAACDAGAPARIPPAGRWRIILPRAGFSAPRRSASTASCCSPRAPRSAAGPMWSRRAIRWGPEPVTAEVRGTKCGPRRATARACHPSRARFARTLRMSGSRLTPPASSSPALRTPWPPRHARR